MSKSRTILTSAAAIVIGFSILSCAMLIEMRHETWRHDVQGARNLLTAEADDIDRTVAIYDSSLRSTAALLADDSLSTAGPRLQQLALFDQNASGPYFGGIRVIAADGQVTHDSRTLSPARASPTEADALRRHRDDPASGLIISTPIGCEADTPGVVNLSRGLRSADGHFAGIVTGTIQLSYVAHLFSGLHLGPHDVVSLFRTDGTFLVHAPVSSCSYRNISGSEVMRRFSARRNGTFVARSTLDGSQRVYSFTHVQNWPLVLDVGLSEADIYAPWRQKALLVGLCLLTIGLISVGLLLVLRRELLARLAAERDALASEARYRLLADHSSDLILRFDGGLHRTYVSPSCQAYGYTPCELLGRHPSAWIHPDDWPAYATEIQKFGSVEVTYRIRRKDGHYVWVEGQYNRLADGGYVAVLRNIDERRQVEARLDHVNEELRRLAATDGLTGLANRRSFDNRLEQEWRRARRSGNNIALLMIDVDQFKEYNDRYGHQAGDHVLAAIGGTILANARRPDDSAARYGGEEFVAILPDTDLFGAIEVAENMRLGVLDLLLPHDVARLGFVSISIGVSSVLARNHMSSTEELLAVADRALYEAKRKGRNQVRAHLIEATLAEDDLLRHDDADRPRS